MLVWEEESPWGWGFLSLMKSRVSNVLVFVSSAVQSRLLRLMNSVFIRLYRNRCERESESRNGEFGDVDHGGVSYRSNHGCDYERP